MNDDQTQPKTYWRSLEQLADTPEFRAFAAKEFPGFANVYEGLGEADLAGGDAGPDRRRFLALSAAALGMAGLTGCRRPDIQILPFSAVPDDQVGHVVPGKPTFYATSVPRPGGSFPVLVESHEGRPTKVEGNPKHPASGGASDVHAQASVLDLYSPDRVLGEKVRGVAFKGQPRKWEEFDAVARKLADQVAKDEGKGLYFLAEQVASPAVRLVREHVAAKLPQAKWHAYEAVDTSNAPEGAKLAFGTPLVAKYKFGKADRVLALDCDFLGLDPDQVEYSREFCGRRRVDTPKEKMNRLYVAESAYSVTGTMADHRLRLPAGQVGDLLLAIGREVVAAGGGKLKGSPPAGLFANAPALPAERAKWAAAVARDLVAHAGKAVVAVGYRQPAWAHAAGHALNQLLGAVEGGAVELREAPPEVLDPGIRPLVEDVRAGKVGTLVVLGGNPALNAPADLNFAGELAKVATKVRLGLYYDHTSEACDWHLPLAHYLEGWGDAEASDGTLLCVQPLIAPLDGQRPASADPASPPPRGGRSALEVLTLLTKYALPDVSNEKKKDTDGKEYFTNPETTSQAVAQRKAYDLVRLSFAKRANVKLDAPDFDAAFNRYKQLGFLPDSGREAKKPAADLAKVAEAVKAVRPAAAPTRDALEVSFHPDYRVVDGRYAMNPWLQELPDPVTKLVWDNAALISPKTAADFRLSTGDRVRLTVGGRTAEVAVFVQPGQADDSVAVVYGQYGEMRIGHVGEGGGFDVFPLRTAAAMHVAAGGKLEPTGRTYDLVTTQEHGVIPEGRDIVREVAAGDSHAGHGHGHSNGKGEAHGKGHEAHPPEANEASQGHAAQTIGLPHGHVTEEDLKRGFQGPYGHGRAKPGESPQEKQERFPLDLSRPAGLDAPHQWGMVVDLSSCTGCSACVVACQSENNVPVVGKSEVKRNREMHWIRIDRYFTQHTRGASADEPQVVSQPVVCQHCEMAPCEGVCPVNAAVHSPEGLNLQVYNRCIGTRYCANNCPYKIRRFNWFDFNKRPLDQLRVPTPLAEGGASLTRNLLPETLKMQKNPDVTVRMRGVMEKCTYCVQRLERAKYGAKIAAAEVAQGRRVVELADREPTKAPAAGTAYRKPKDPLKAGYDLDANGAVVVPDGFVNTACAQACPSGAIVFGNALDPDSRVSKLKKLDGDYLLLGEINTKPRTSYLPRVRNPNPELVG